MDSIGRNYPRFLPKTRETYDAVSKDAFFWIFDLLLGDRINELVLALGPPKKGYWKEFGITLGLWDENVDTKNSGVYSRASRSLKKLICYIFGINYNGFSNEKMNELYRFLLSNSL